MEKAGIQMDAHGEITFSDSFVTQGEMLAQARVGDFLFSKAPLSMPGNLFCVRIVDDHSGVCLFYAYRRSDVATQWFQYLLVERQSIGNCGYRG